MRIAMLSDISFILSLSEPVITVFDLALSWRDIVLGVGGFFLLTKGTREIHAEVEGFHERLGTAKASYAGVIMQIVVLDFVFSIDSVITAVGVAEHLVIMVAAVIISIAIMMIAATPVANFVNRHPTVKMLSLSFLLLIGVALVADAAHFHIPREYIYFAIAFSGLVETLNHLATRRRATRRKKT